VAVALVLAAGLGERLGLGRPKALAELAGRPLWRWSVEVLSGMDEIDRVVMALPAGIEAPAGVVGVPGGAVRSESVLRALSAAGDGEDGEAVLVHDAARPLLTAEIVRAALVAFDGGGVDAAIAASPVTDTVKQADEGGRVLRTLERSGLWAVQTPQVFRRDALRRALEAPAEVLVEATDDAWLVERTGGTVLIVPSPRENLKVTTPLDLQVAELLLARRQSVASGLSASA
jgi:2-C-methyl-D-erythritol 4-phosphate cytidylyltransferase